jgi:guanine deaminase
MITVPINISLKTMGGERLNMGKSFAVKGNVIYTKTKTQFTSVSHGYIVCENGVVTDVYEELPVRYKDIDFIDYGDHIIIPGLTDLHVHAPQFAYRGLGMDLELLPWLETYAFKEEAKYSSEEYAHSAYQAFCAALKKSATTHASIFATLHVNATRILMDLLEETGLVTCVGNVNMDRNSPDYLVQTTQESITDTELWLQSVLNHYQRTKPILTPRFVPSCTGELMAAIGKMALEYGVSVQSHLSENKAEIEWVQKLHPACSSYSNVYDQYGLFGRSVPTIMAHCVYPREEELDLIRENGVYIAHCPGSNMNISSGIAPVREMINRGIHVGLGSDVAGGFSLSMFRAVSDAIQVSKLYAVLVDATQKPLMLPEAFYMATKGGGSFWGKVGSFEPGYDMNAVVIDDGVLNHHAGLTIEQRLERIVYLSADEQITAKYVNGILL